jgi:hypothetical protein
MNTPILLQRSTAVRGWRVTGSIALATRRDWEPALLKLAVAHGRVTVDTVVAELLGGRSPIARRLLDVCARLGLLERDRGAWTATEAGRIAAQTGVVLVPERGTWTLWVAEDPLLASPIVAVTPWREPSAYDERGKNVRRSVQPLPAVLTSTIGVVIEPPSGRRRAVRIDDLGTEARGELADEQASLKVTLTIAPASVRVHVAGTIEGAQVDAEEPAPDLSHEQAWLALLRRAGMERQWDTHRGALWVSFKDTSAPERTSMTRAIGFSRPTLDRLGTFDDAEVAGVPLRPKSPSDATEWAEWRLVRGITTYLPDDALAEAYRAAAQPFEDIAAPCPSRHELALRARGVDRPSPQYWRLQAPADWSILGRRR